MENGQDERDELFEDAARIMVENQTATSSLLQRKLKLGYNRAGRLKNALKEAGIFLEEPEYPFRQTMLIKNIEELNKLLKRLNP